MRNAADSTDVHSLAMESSVSELITRVGSRVLAARKAKRYSRRELSERSGVSTRYLVQLEGGEGNISIGLLQRLAIALELSIDSLVGKDDTTSDDVTHMISQYRRADASTRAHVMRVLDPEGMRENKAERICLIGLRGAGKSTLGALLSETYDVPFIELNAEIERSAGIPLGEIIALYGEEGYRTLEAETLRGIIADHQRMVLAVAGGLVENSNTFANLLRYCHTVWLKADPSEHMERVRAQGDLRPMAGNPRAMTQLREILLARESRYKQADIHLDTSGKSVDASLAELCKLVSSHHLMTSNTAVTSYSPVADKE
ncbi:MAG: helix-turn-helix transcriptional regulator [Granulosicoccus sp.]